MSIKTLGFDRCRAGDAESNFVGHSFAVLLRSNSGCPSRRGKQENRAVGHDAVNVENDQLYLFGALFGHGRILTVGRHKYSMANNWRKSQKRLELPPCPWPRFPFRS